MNKRFLFLLTTHILQYHRPILQSPRTAVVFGGKGLEEGDVAVVVESRKGRKQGTFCTRHIFVSDVDSYCATLYFAKGTVFRGNGIIRVISFNSSYSPSTAFRGYEYLQATASWICAAPAARANFGVSRRHSPSSPPLDILVARIKICLSCGSKESSCTDARL